MPEQLQEYLEYVNNGFTAFYIFEVIIKISAHGKRYFLSGWNIFDFTIIACSIVAFSLFYIGIIEPNTSGMSIRSFKLLRIFKILKNNESLRVIF